MNTPTEWWHTAYSPKEPKSRWLGIFRRRLPLQEHHPHLLTVPYSRPGLPRKLSPSRSLPYVAGCLSVGWPQAQAINLFAQSLEPVVDISGTVSLNVILLNDESVAQARPDDTWENRLWELIKLKEPSISAGPEISLAKRLKYLLQPPKELLLSSKGPLEWPGTLFPYQIEGVDILLSREALLLADDMGLGKTIQAAAALRILVLQRRIEAALLVVPASLTGQWRREIHKWAPELRISTIDGPPEERAYQWAAGAHVFITSYETLRSDFTGNPQSPPRRRVWDLVILDEAQKIKNRDTEISVKCKLLCRRRAWALTGTPLENREDDLASILEFITPLKPNEPLRRLMPGAELWEKHRNLQLRRKKADVLTQLPPKTVTRVRLPLQGAQHESYDKAEKKGIIQLKEKGASLRVENILELILRLKQICNFCPVTGQSAKLDDVVERLYILESEGHRALIFSQFTDDKYGVRAICANLQPWQPLLYTGDLNLTQKEAVIREFKSNPARKVLVLSLRAGGQGLNLQDASYVFHFDRWWNPAMEHQAEDRSHRLGQPMPVHIYKYICENTVEERIEQILQEKQLLFDEMVDDVTIDLRAKLSTKELYGLFGLLPPST